MEKVFKILIFTDLDGSLLHRDTFKFDEVKDYLIQLISKGIFIIPNTSKTEKEILEFLNDLGSSLPFISENGAAINGLDLLNTNFPKELILSREKENIIKIFKKSVPINLVNKCKWLFEMDKKKQSLIFGLKDEKLKLTGTIYLSDGVTPAKDVILFIEQPDENGNFDLRKDNEKRYVHHRA